MNRADVCFLIDTSLAAGRPDYARQLAQQWLSQRPGDLRVRLELARVYSLDGQPGDALDVLDGITAVDFEHGAAHHLIGQLRPETRSGAYGAAHVISGGPLPAEVEPPPWMAPARRAITALSAGQFHSARQFAETALRQEGAPPLVSLILLKTHWQAGQLSLALPLAEGFHERWPQGLAVMLCLAEGLFQAGDSHRAVAVLHAASALDPSGDVVVRYWGVSHPYRDLWPQPATVSLPGPIPYEVSVLLGVNRISAPAADAGPGVYKGGASRPADIGRLLPETRRAGGRRYAAPKSGPAGRPAEELRDIRHQLDAVASRVGLARYHRRPAHVILYSTKLLHDKFGPQVASEIIQLIEELAAVTARRHGLPVTLFAPDSPERLAPFNLAEVDPANPWAIKTLLHDLDRQLARRGRAITSLLIVGGDDLLPFHRLPNPTDDVDNDVPSDNPYGTTDDNYFVPEWPVGRLPSPCGSDPEPLARLIRQAIAAHKAIAQPSVRARIQPLIEACLRFWPWRRAASPPSSVGYSASVWKEAALAVFAPIGTARYLHTSPPLDSVSAPDTHRSQLTYFNLHGLEDSADWFGQRDLSDGYGPLFPTALTPAGIAANGERHAFAPRVVFTEACYGANILNKLQPDAALCLQFLDRGARALVGSTKIAYGSVTTPLIGADLLGRAFWEGLLAGLPVGEALRRAKFHLAQVMHRRQNFLDGEDQKTLISFVLYGDPLLKAVAGPARAKAAKSLPTLQTTAMEYEAAADGDLRPETVAEIKSLLARYLPGSESAEVALSRPASLLGAKGRPPLAHRVCTLSKTIRFDHCVIPTFARVTVNKAGKVIKVAVSR